MRAAVAALVLLAALAGGRAFAVQPDEVLADPALEARARHISQGLRCLVCQNQSIDDSDADLARDLRIILRERLTAGDSDEKAIRFLTARYGDFVLLKPPVEPATWALWFGPAALLLIGGGALGFAIHRRNRIPQAAVAALSDDERARLAAILKDDQRS
ncbi:MAG TPA: cytochrome c-type biogenesis protein [Alphaproteobacteria bacterium]|jgi:cytochrome c-type biogenesis protein CcmH